MKHSLTLAAVAALALATQATAATVGSALIDRQFIDNSTGQVYIYGGGRLASNTKFDQFSWFGNNFAGSRTVTPILFEVVSTGKYVVRGVGTARTHAASNSIQTAAFGLAYGTDIASNANFTFGFTNGLVNSSGVFTSTSAGAVDFTNGVSSGTGLSGAGTTNRWVYTPSVVSISLALGTSFGFDNGSDIGLNSLTTNQFANDRTYSASASTVSAIPLPASSLMGLSILAAGAISRRR